MGYYDRHRSNRSDVIKVPTSIIDDALESLKDKEKQELLIRKNTSGLRRFVELDPYNLSSKQITALHKAAQKIKGDPQYKGELEFLYSAQRDPSSVTVKNVREVATALRQFLTDGFIKGWLFERAEYGALTPHLVTKVDYTAPARYVTERVTVTLTYQDVSGKPEESHKSIYFSTLMNAYRAMNQEAAERAQAEIEAAQAELSDAGDEDDDELTKDERRKLRLKREALEQKMRESMTLKEGVPMERLLSQLDLYKENEELHKSYDKQVDRFMRFIKMFGSQVRVRGEGEMVSDDDDHDRYWWSRASTDSMLVDGRPSRAIVDTRPFQDISGESSGKRRKKREDDEQAEDEVSIDDLTKEDFFGIKPANECNSFTRKADDVGYSIPLHLYLKIFHLEKHKFYKLHVVNMVPYKYKKEMKDQLVLPEDVMELAEMLISTEVEDAEDIVEGKSQGTLITCIGDPGLGKTLLAEVLSEAVEKPLYKFQAAQLGLDPETLEKNLARLLHRAERWGCVVMIDEANAYIHDRGVDVTQNAIVGVFLRRLEYYRGTMILTTNQTNADGTDMDIDDAILSRSSAVIVFELPTAEQAKKIWKDQATLLKAKVGDNVIDLAVAKFAYSGRSIRQLLRLTWRLVRNRKLTEIKMEHLVRASKFIAVSRKERREQAARKKVTT